MKKTTYFLIALLFASICLSCTNDSSNGQVNEVAEAFARNYFNWHFKECQNLVTPESVKMLSYVASNVTEADIDMLHSLEEDATIELMNCELENDTTGLAEVYVFNALLRDTIGTTAKRHAEAVTTLRLVKRRKWLIDLTQGAPRMAFPQQNGTPDHDQDSDE